MHHAVLDAFPALAALIQSAANAASHMAQAEPYIRVKVCFDIVHSL